MHPVTGLAFVMPRRVDEADVQESVSPRGQLLLACCRSGYEFFGKVAQRYIELLMEKGAASELIQLANVDRQFSDTETCARLEIDVSGDDVFLFQSLLDPTSNRSIDQNYMAFMVAIRTMREVGANHITGVFPYLAYARQDKPTRFTREPATAKLIADLTVAAGIDRLITWDPHCTPIHGFYGQVPINNLEPLPLFLSAYRRFQNQLEVICIAPDGGRFQISHLPGPIIDLNCAIASKDRPNSEEAVISEVIGDFSGKQTAIVVDGMISSGGTIYELVKKLVNEKGITEVLIGVSHNLCMEVARQRLIDLSEHYGLKQLVVTDSIPQTKLFRELPFISIASLADIFARVINRIHFNRSITLAINGGIENV